ncbi:hypothetical protein ACN263_15665 [Micromonospora sp. WMMD729]|uniref:hypothetical protein n=1 Tax=Micromonospora sp. WMMD729 TaxID=3404127 RepID=UPI003BF54B91
MTPTQVSIHTGMTTGQRMVRKLCKWLFFGLLLGVLPIVCQTGVLWLQGNTSEAIDVFGDGELFFLAVALSTAAVGDLVFDRRIDGHADIAHGLAIAAALIIITLAAVGYGAAKTVDEMSGSAVALAASPSATPLPKSVGVSAPDVPDSIGVAPTVLGGAPATMGAAPESPRAQSTAAAQTAEDRRNRITQVSVWVLLFAIVTSVANVVLSERW